ncbi:phosphoserine phosphatase [Schizosaccharomyces japonicus yFS275]|uniref:phosphoserine phosphatase n=1 Tax=Schizosaccharomyces japonicus (strain yFS275 / FY16936) TaxID=402676 RepID=B6K6U9_SCHJY|nr:phosphoserine phosphatase [Schizosaccharomyces japonicus yFS275]EEB09253.1 phosphoserine phosphatase [Schizosaccharomyces japonicus yFS275]
MLDYFVIISSKKQEIISEVKDLFASSDIRDLGSEWTEVSGKLKGTFDDAKEACFQISQNRKCDCNCIDGEVYEAEKKLVVFDMDSTLIQQECIDELAAEAGVAEEIKKITALAMQGEIDFSESLRRRVGLLKGLSSNIIDKVIAKITFTPGAKELCQSLRALGATTVVASGGFIPMAKYVQKELGIDYAFANELEIEDGILTGKVKGKILDGKRKAQILCEKVVELQVPEINTVAIGDGANDLIMMEEAGLGIAFNAKPKVQQKADSRINQPSLLNVMYLFGFDTHRQHKLLSE